VLIATSNDQRKTQITFNIYADFAAKSYFIGYLIPPTDSAHTFEYVRYLACCPIKTFEDIVRKMSFEGSESGQLTSLKDLTFSGRIFIYHYDFLTLEQIVALRSVYKKKNLSVQFRGIDYVAEETRNKKR
jgi:hypothetical protein